MFLDEIGEIDATIQVKLLRFLGERTFERVGSNKTLTADVRLVAATNKNLEELVKAGKFREDLFFRLRVVEIELPPLRERTGDIPLLAQSFLREFAKENGKPVNDFTADALEALMNYSWPGNVRELRTAIEHAVVLCRGERISLRDLPPSVRGGGGGRHEIVARKSFDGEGRRETIDRARVERDGRQPHAGGAKNRHEPADVSPQAARVSPGRILIYDDRGTDSGADPQLEVGGARRLNYLALTWRCSAWLVWYDLHCYRNFSSPEAMDAAQVARNVAEGKGFSTDFIRPFSIYLLQKHNHAVARRRPARQTNGGSTSAVLPTWPMRRLYPLVLAGCWKIHDAGLERGFARPRFGRRADISSVTRRNFSSPFSTSFCCWRSCC